MAEATPFWPQILFPLLLSLCVVNGVNCLEEKKVLHLQKFQWKQKSTNPNCFSQKSKREKGATILEMKHPDSCLRLTINWNKRLRQRLIFDDLHVRLLQSRFKNMVNGNIDDASKAQIPLTSGMELQTLNYIVKVELGGRQMTVIVDTGSDLTWVQCQPCRLCYNQQDPLFNPSLSPSYQTVLCNSSACQTLQFATGNAGVCGTDAITCNYAVSYGDGSYTRGELGREQLKLGSTTVNDFLFGCGRNNRGLFGGASGLVGFGRSNISLVSQTSAIFGGVFSYCLPSTETEASGSLTLGGDASVFKNSTPVSYTKMIPNPQLPTFYFLNLTGISIGGVGLQDLTFAKTGFLIDSGTVITRLPPSIYRAVRTEFLKQFMGFPSASGYSILDTCFNLTGNEEVTIPTIKMHFDGDAEVNVDADGVFYTVKSDASQVCLALASLSYEDEIGVIGNYQQKNLRVLYDTKESKVGFAEETCSFA